MSVGYSRRTSCSPSAMASGVGGQQLLQVGLDAVLLQARVDAELVGAVGEHLLEGDGQRLALGVGDGPLALRPRRACWGRSSS